MRLILLKLVLVLGVSSCAAAQSDLAAAQQDQFTLERAVLVMRHGVRPPTKSATAMASLSDAPWPDDAAWGAAPGELTPHGSLAIQKLGTDLRQFYVAQGLLTPSTALAQQTLLWADGADQRTRATAQALALGLARDSEQPIAVAWSKSDVDPLFDGLNGGVCALDPDATRQAVRENGAPDTRQTEQAMEKLQAVMAPQACQKGAGTCLDGASKLTVSATEAKISGPLSIGATVSEVFLLEYENGLPMEQVGWGRVDRNSIGELLAIHERAAALTRRTPYIAIRRAYALVRFVLSALIEDNAQSTMPEVPGAARLIVLTGHDTNLSNLAGVFSLDWHLPDQPDVTAPGTAIAFERWRDHQSGRAILRLRLFYQDPEQVRNLSDTPAHQVALQSTICSANAHCASADLASVAKAVNALLPKNCHQ